jgi:hypothetical protein
MVIGPGAPTLVSVGNRGDQTKGCVDEAVAESASGEPNGGAGPSDQGRKSPRGQKTSPALEGARTAINELYSHGVPAQHVEPNVMLCKRVAKKMKQCGFPEVSNDTILRAAGRRK